MNIRILITACLLVSAPYVPYEYIEYLKWVIVIISIECFFSSIIEHEISKVFSFLFIVVAILFNPLVPFYFWKLTWAIIDIVSSLIFVSYFIYYYNIKLKGKLLLLTSFFSVVYGPRR